MSIHRIDDLQETSTLGHSTTDHKSTALGPDASWDALASLALDEEPIQRPFLARAWGILRRPTVFLGVLIAALAYPAYRGLSGGPSLPNFPGRDHQAAVPAEGTSVALSPLSDPSRAPQAVVRDSKPVLEVILSPPEGLDPSLKWKVTVTHPGREIWKSKWARPFEEVKGEPRLAFQLDGRDLPEGPLTITLEEARRKGDEAGAKRAVYRMRVKKRE
jgi:hypothetical protein